MAEHSHQSQVEEIVGRIVASGRRRTMSRQAVIQVIVDCHGHISADDIATRVQEDFPSMDVSTVYHLRDHPHHHLCCEKCGSVQELPVSLMKSVEADLLEEFGFELHQRPLGLFGLCKDCRN